MNQKTLIAISLVSLSIIGYFVFETLSWLATSIKDVSPSVGAALIAGVATVISAVFIASYNSRKAKERVAFEAHREKKAEIYSEFMSMFTQLMRNAKKGNDILPKNIEEFFYNFIAKITIYGGPSVVKAYANWHTDSANDDRLLLIDKLFREMRTDLGESNKGIEANELLGLYIAGGKSELAKEASNAINTNN